MKSLKYLLSLLCAALLSVNLAEARNITFLTHFIKPFSYQEDGVIKGFAVDLVREMMKIQGYPDKLTIYPFTRALKIVQHSPNYALFIVARRAEREKTVKWVGPLITSGVYFYKKKGAEIKVESLQDIKRKYSVIVQKDNADHYFLKEKGFTRLYTTNDQMRSIQMVYKGKIDLTPISEFVMPEMAREARIDVNNIERIDLKLYDSTLFLAFSRETPDTVVAQWQQAFDSLKASGKYQSLYNKYLQ